MNREDFPMLKQPYIYFNSAATTYTPQVVIDKINDYYQNYNVNLGRGVNQLSYQVTEMYEKVRLDLADFLKINKTNLIFVRGTTEGINFIANHLEKKLKKGDQILITNEEHHSLFVTMQQLALKNNLEFKVVDFEQLENSITAKTKLVATSHYTNVLGKRSNLEKLVSLKKQYPFELLVDGAQGIVHQLIDLKEIDYYTFSGHKIYGPNGVGVLYVKDIENLTPYHYGGEMVNIVLEDKSTFKEAPYCFEAGTMMIPEVLGLGEAIKYIKKIGYLKINNHIKKLRDYLIVELKKIDQMIIYNETIDSHFITFNIKNIHAHDIATFLDQNNIIVRAGHHCASPLNEKLNVSATVRISLGLYNTIEECQILIETLKRKGAYLDELFK